MSASTVDQENLKEFTTRAQEWWDPEGPFKPLHALNPTRLGFLIEHIMKAQDESKRAPSPPASLEKALPLEGIRLLDVGCGGGLVSEPLAKAGAIVTGLDAGAENILVAQQHALQEGVEVTYFDQALETYTPSELYDVVLALEIVEHVTCVPTFIQECYRVLKPGGLLILSTLNRTLKSFALGIVGAEYLLRWVPKGTHNWQQFLKPSELIQAVRKAGGAPHLLKGLAYQPFSQSWVLSDDLDVNYFLTASKPTT